MACEVDAKPGVSTVKWERNGRFIDTNFKHTIPRVTIQDAGTYVCSADNGLGQAGKAELKLDVLYGPVVTVEGQQREFNEGKNDDDSVCGVVFFQTINPHYLPSPTRYLLSVPTVPYNAIPPTLILWFFFQSQLLLLD